MAVIAINALSLRPGGGLQVIAGLLSRFSGQNTYLVLWSDPQSLPILQAAAGKTANIAFMDPVGDSTNSRLFRWQMTSMAAWLKTQGVDAVLNVNHHYPSGDIPQVVYHLNVLRFERPKRSIWQRGELADRLRDWRAKVALSSAHTNVFESGYLETLAVKRLGKVTNGSVIQIGIDEKRLDNDPPPQADPEPRILALTSPQPHKDNPTLIRMLAELVKLCPDTNWRLAIAGGRSPEVFSDLNDLADELGVAERIEWLGFRNHEELSKIGHKSLCLVSTSRVESFCMVALEAMSWNCPPIVANATSMPESVGDAGLLAEPGNPRDFAEKVIALQDDEKKREALILRGRAHLDGLTWSNAARCFEVIFRDLENAQKN